MSIDIELGEMKTKYEKARMIGSRALQLSMGAPMMVKLTKKQLEEINFNPVEIAKLEFDAGKLPLEVKRILPHEDGTMY